MRASVNDQNREMQMLGEETLAAEARGRAASALAGLARARHYLRRGYVLRELNDEGRSIKNCNLTNLAGLVAAALRAGCGSAPPATQAM